MLAAVEFDKEASPRQIDVEMQEDPVNRTITFACLLLICSLPILAQQASTVGNNPIIPPLVNFRGLLTDLNGKALAGPVGVTFSLYKGSQGGAPLWVETQNVQVDKSGHYSVELGAASSQGLPPELFASGEARWLGVQAQGSVELPRVLLVSVPYALKALDAETIGGKPASSFMLAPASGSGAPAPSSVAITGNGSANFIPRFTGKTTIADSNIFENPKGDVGVGTTTPAGKLDVEGTADFRDTLTLFPAGKHATLSIHGTAFAVSDTGKVTFVADQTFPGAGTVTNVGSGAGLTGGPITGSGSLSIANGGVTNAMLVHHALTVTASSPLSGGGVVALGGSTSLGLKACAANQVLQFVSGAWACSNAATGTVTKVASGAGLTGGPITGSGTLSIANSGVLNAMLAHHSLSVTASSPLSGGGVIALGGSASLGLKACSANQILQFVSGAWACANVAAGTVTSVATGAGLTGGPITNSGTLSIADRGVTNPMLAHPSLTVDAGTDLTGGGLIALGGTITLNLDTTKVPQLTGNNSFNGNQSVTGNLSATGKVSGQTSEGSGVSGLATGATGVGVLGTSSATTGTPAGMEGVAASGYGVYGVNNAGNGFNPGVIGINSSLSGPAVEGQAQSTAGSTVGVEGQALSSSGTGVLGVASSSLGFTLGVNGISFSTAGAGVLGQAPTKKFSQTASGIQGSYSPGVWGDTTAATREGAGVIASADNNYAMFAANNSTGVPTIYGENETSDTSALVLEALGSTVGGSCTMDVSGNLKCSGTVGADAAVDGGARKVSLYGVQSAENWFEDAGSGQLHNGSARIALDPTFAQTVNTAVEYHVFLTPNGDCKGLYVDQKTATSFEVHELGGGTSSVGFDYRIMAKRSGFERVRLADDTRALAATALAQRKGGNPQD